MQKVKLAVLVVAATSVFVASSASVAVAAPAPGASTDAVVAELRDRFQSVGISSDVQDRLIEKVLSGAALDADTEATPVSSETTKVDGFEKTRNVYADGSVAIGSVETPQEESGGGFSTKSIRDCSHRVDRAGTNIYTGCEIAWDAATWSVSWTADYDYNVNGSAITSAKGVHFGGVGDFSGERAEIITLRADRNGTAVAEGGVNQKLTVAGVGSTRRVGVRLKVATRWTGRKARESSFST